MGDAEAPAPRGGGLSKPTQLGVREGVMLKAEKGLMGARKWSKKWVRADENKLEYYNTAKRPKPGDNPRKIFVLASCNISEHRTDDAKNPFCFKIQNAVTGYSAVFSAPSGLELTEWLEFLQIVLEEATRRDDVDYLADEEEDRPQINLDAIHEFFSQNCETVAKDGSQTLEATRLGSLLAHLGLPLNQEAIQAVLLEVDRRKTGHVHKQDFISWWVRFQTMTPNAQNDNDGGLARPTMAGGGHDGVGGGGMGGGDDGGAGDQAVAGDEADVAPALLDFSFKRPNKDVSMLLSLEVPRIENLIQPPQLNVSEDEWNNVYQTLLTMPEESMEDSMHKAMQIAGFTGLFLEVAVKGVHAIVSEYALPARAKTAKPLRIVEDDDEDAGLDLLQAQEEVYVYRGLLFRLANKGVGEADLDPTEQRRRTVGAADIMQHKIAGNELRGLLWVNEAVASMRSNASRDPEQPYVELNTPLTCVVDFLGFRFYVMSIPPIDEERTLVHGRRESTGQIKDDVAVMRDVMKNLGKELNLRVHRAPSATFDAGPTMGPQTMLAMDLQVHRCDDNRVYLMNFSRILPPDMPRPGTHALLTHQMRPEFVQQYGGGRLCADAYRIDAADAPDLGDADREHIEASSNLVMKVVQRVANALDALEVLPYDSHTLIHYLHSNGVNVRYLGALFRLTRLPHVRSMILAEATARVCKVVFCQALRTVLRKGKAESLLAEARRRSKDSHFREHNARLQADVEASVPEFFNLVLGKSDESDELWNTVILPMLNAKFDIDVPPATRYTLIHPPQLMHCLCEQLGVRMRDASDYRYKSERPFVTTDIALAFPKTKWRMNTAIRANAISMRAEELLAAGMHNKAYRSLLLQLSLMDAAYGTLADDTYRARKLYELAETAFVMRNFQLADKFATAALSHTGGHTPLAGRIHHLHLSILYKMGMREDAVESFDHALQVYSYALGLHHPLIVTLYGTLADLYFFDSHVDLSYAFLGMALELSGKSLGFAHLVNAQYNMKMGCLLFFRGEVQASTRAYQKALKIFDKGLEGGMHLELDVAACFFNMAEVLTECGELSRAVDCSEKGLKLRMEKLQPDNQAVVLSQRQLAALCERQDDVPKAIKLYEQALDVLKQREGDSEALEAVRLITRKVLSLVLRQQTLPVRTLIRGTVEEVFDKSPLGDVFLELAMPYVAEQLYKRPPALYLHLLLKCVPTLGEGRIVWDAADEYMRTQARELQQKEARRGLSANSGSEAGHDDEDGGYNSHGDGNEEDKDDNAGDEFEEDGVGGRLRSVKEEDERSTQDYGDPQRAGSARPGSQTYSQAGRSRHTSAYSDDDTGAGPRSRPDASANDDDIHDEDDDAEEAVSVPPLPVQLLIVTKMALELELEDEFIQERNAPELQYDTNIGMPAPVLKNNTNQVTDTATAAKGAVNQYGAMSGIGRL